MNPMVAARDLLCVWSSATAVRPKRILFGGKSAERFASRNWARVVVGETLSVTPKSFWPEVPYMTNGREEAAEAQKLSAHYTERGVAVVVAAMFVVFVVVVVFGGGGGSSVNSGCRRITRK